MSKKTKKSVQMMEFHVFYYLLPIPGREYLGEDVALMRRSIFAANYCEAVRKWEGMIDSESLIVDPEYLLAEARPEISGGLEAKFGVFLS